MKREWVPIWLFCFIVYQTAAQAFELEVYVRQFEHETPIADGKIYAVIDDQNVMLATTNEEGLATIFLTSTNPLTLFIEASPVETKISGFFSWFFYEATKSMVPPLSVLIETVSGFLSTPRIYSGLIYPGTKNYTGEYGRITFQVPYEGMINYLHSALAVHFSSESKPDHCHLVTTVTPEDKSLKDCPHGLSGVKVLMTPPRYEARYYFDVLRRVPPDYCKTDLFINLGTVPMLMRGGALACDLASTLLGVNCTEGISDVTSYFGIDAVDREVTSEDGGVMFLNIPVREEPYKISTYKAGYLFEDIEFVCRPNALVNISPPQGPVGKKILQTPCGWLEPYCPVN